MNRQELRSAIDFLFSTDVLKRRISNTNMALRRPNMDPETRGRIMGHLEILDYLRDRAVKDIFPEDMDRFAPDRPQAQTFDDLLHAYTNGSTPADPEAERVAPLPRRPAWDTR